MSKEAIIKELPESLVLQLRSWVRTSSGIGLFTITPAYEGMPGNPSYGSRVLADFTEVSMLERSIDALPLRYREAVRLFWIYEGNDLTWLGRRLAVDWRTAEKRVRDGHDRLRQELAMREASYERHLERRHAYA